MDESMTECKPNLSLSVVWFTFSAGTARRGLESRPNVNQILLWPGFWFILPAGSARHELYCQRVVAFPESGATIS